MKYPRSFIFAFFTALAGCGGGGGGGSSTPSSPGTSNPGTTTPSSPTSITLSYDIPDLIQASYNGNTLKGKSSITVPVGATANIAISVHPGFVWSGVTGANASYANGVLSVSAGSSDASINVSMPSLADYGKPHIYSAAYDRSAIYRDELGKTATNIEVFAAVSPDYKVVLSYKGLDPVTKAEVARDVQLLDDGQGADKKSGDYRFSTAFKTDLLPLYEYMGVAHYDARVHVLDKSGADVSSAGEAKTGMSLVVVDRAKAATVTKLSDDVYASSSVVNVVVSGTSLRFRGDAQDADFALPAMKRVLAYYPDVFDEAAFFYAGNVGPDVGREFSFDVKNDVTGIGKQVMDNSAAWGSAGVLRHVAQLTGGTTGPFMHEFTHRFGFMLNDARLPLTDGDSCKCHFDEWNQIIWDPISTSGGVGITQLPSGDWMLAPYSGRIAHTHSDMMLYLMGLIAPGELPSQAFVVDPSGKLPQGQTIPASKVKVVSASDIASVYGVRSPAYGVAPTNFRAAFVLITSGRPALPEEIAAVEAQAKFYASRGSSSADYPHAGWENGLAFYDSTKGRGSLVTELPAHK